VVGGEESEKEGEEGDNQGMKDQKGVVKGEKDEKDITDKLVNLSVGEGLQAEDEDDDDWEVVS
jgi:hypothetical protein